MNDPASGCQGKVAHTNVAEAKQAIWRMGRSKGRRHGRLEPYRCEFCGLFHVGSGARR